jgi:formate/nitrite transporter FocA (FNT family)
LGNAFGGSGDGAGIRPSRGGEAFAALLIGALWLFVSSPYICMVLGSLNLITGKSLRIPYMYSLHVLTVMTVGLCIFFHWKPGLLVALGNIVAGGLWAYYFRGALSVQNEPTKPHTPV